jgi:cytochrome c biogenesis protein CcmG, thiol:disulfide interchange protein DsbE
MTIRQQWAAVAAVVACVALGVLAATHFLADELFPVTVGVEAPPFSARPLDSEDASPRTLQDYRGDVVLLNLWATWCAPCREEMPSMQAVHEALAPEGLRVVAVSIDQRGQRQTIRDFVAELGLTFEVLHDETGAMTRRYQTTGVPETWVLDRSGIIRKKQIGPADWNSEANRALFERLLSEGRG